MALNKVYNMNPLNFLTSCLNRPFKRLQVVSNQIKLTSIKARYFTTIYARPLSLNDEKNTFKFISGASNQQHSKIKLLSEYRKLYPTRTVTTVSKNLTLYDLSTNSLPIMCQLRCMSVDKNSSFETNEEIVRWKIKEKETLMLEAKEEFIEGIQETKAKVKEKMEEIIERENIWTIPNLLCISRIIASPALLWLVVTSQYQIGLGLFFVAGITDLLDGTIARVFPSQASRLGSFLDPLADKILVAALFLGLTYQGLIPVALTGLIIYRDLCIIGGACYVRFTSLPPPRTVARYFDATHATAQLAPTTISKINTVIQLSLITAALAAPVFLYQDHYLYTTLCILTAISTLASGTSYIFSNDTYTFVNKMKKTEDEKK